MAAMTVTVDHFADLKALRERLRGGRTKEPLSGGNVSTTADIQQVTGELAGETAHISAQTDGFATAVPKFQEALVYAVRAPADAAITSVVGFGDSVLQLTAGSTTLARTRGLALRAQSNFRTVHERAREALVLATDLGVEITYWRTRTEHCTGRVQKCRTLTGKFADGAQSQFAQTQERIAVAQGDCARAVESYRSAKRHQERCEEARTIRNFLTFGIGEVLDIGRFTRSVKNSGRTMRTAQANQRAAEAQRDAARNELDVRLAEQRNIEDASTRLEALGPALAQAARALDEYRARLTEGTNTALNVSVFFGGLIAHTAAWDVIASAPALAVAVMKLQQQLGSNTRLTGVFITSPVVLNDELKRLADSDVPPDEISALM